LAAINDLIAQVEDSALRTRLQEEAERLTKEKKFGLVFEEHLPELTPIYKASVRRGSQVTRRDQSLAETWRVLSVMKETALCLNLASGDEQQIPVSELVVVRRFGEPIYPALTPLDEIENGPAEAPWHTIIEADNYHALQLLTYVYAGQVDCIYIDPPYNTGARDWKYNNDYVDGNDRWRHSKWLAMMRRRLVLAKQLLNLDTGVLIVTIDEHEVHHLRMLLQEVLPEMYFQMVTAVTNPKGVTQGRFSRVEEYQLFCFGRNTGVRGWDDDLLNPKKESSKPRWKGLLRSGTNARRADRKHMFYPVLIDEEKGTVVGTGLPLDFDQEPDIGEKINKLFCAWPIRADGTYGNWGVGHTTLRSLIEKGYVSAGRYDPKRKTYGISYLSQLLRDQIKSGEIQILNLDHERNVVEVVYAESAERKIKTIWHRTLHDAGAYGADLISNILDQSRAFSFPKSLYYVRDALASVVLYKPEALILDFFAGSGTTLHAVNLLNATDNGNRHCILVTNNEVSEEEAKQLIRQGLCPGDKAWEQQGICRSVTWPRSKFTIRGQRDDGTELKGTYFSGKLVTKQKARIFRQLAFIDPDVLQTAARKKEIVSLIEAVPMSQIQANTAFFVSDDTRHTAAVLFDDNQRDAFLEALDDLDHVTHFFIVTRDNKLFRQLKKEIEALLGPIEVPEEEKRPMCDGFPANLVYFRLDFLEKDEVALGRQFREILPLLWLRAGAVGPRPELQAGDDLPAMLLPPHNHFAVLLDETCFADFQEAAAARPDLTHIFLVTDSADTFRDLAAQLTAPHIIQLYRDYLENFTINKGEAA
jgi:adenine-specific DNA-methyltransferase